MKKDLEISVDAAKSLLDEKEKMNRRDFLAATGKVIIPTLGILGLGLGLSRKAQAGCSFECSSGCSGYCGSDCSNSCSNNCGGGCRGGCEGVCGGCDGSCKNGCEGTMWSKSN